jgi:hypothetical protein
MNEDYNINLPPDADDLSRHAPALFGLKNAREGFVVPALYFEELSERIIHMTAIPEDGGLILPENYFEALPSVIEAKTTLPDESGLTSPENYFEELHDRLEAQLILKSGLPTMEDEVPDEYFGQMENELHVHIALDNIRQEEGFEVPQNYFADITQRILNNTSLSAEAVNDDQVPEGYFDALPDKVIAVIKSETSQETGRVRTLVSWTREHWRVMSVAASVALLIVMGWLFLNIKPEGAGELRVATYARVTPERVPDIAPSAPESADVITDVAVEVPRKRETIKPNPVQEVLMNDEEISAQLGQIDESLVIEFVTESEAIEPADDVLNAEMMEYLMNDNTGLEVFDPGDK